jgi:hypothetical protein
MLANNPLGLVHNGLMAVLDADATLQTLLGNKPGNIARWLGSSRVSDPEDLISDDHPRLSLLEKGTENLVHHSSSHTEWHVKWELQVSTAEQWLHTLIDINWRIFVAIKGWKTYFDANVLYNGEPLVFQLKTTETTNILDRNELNRGIRGWSAIWNGVTKMQFTTSELT